MISLIATVLNEGDNIKQLLDSLVQQTHQPDQIVIVDGGSQDNTVAILQSYMSQLPLRIFIEAGCNISRGRNRGITEAHGDIVVVTDAGTRLPRTWLEHIVRPLLQTSDVQAVAGFFEANPHSIFEVAMGATVLPLREEIQPETFLPSSRSVAFRKAIAQKIGGYPEWLDYCEDLIFDLRCKQVAGPFYFAPEAWVYFRPRSSLRAFFKQYYLYARGDGKADLWRKRHFIRYITYLVALPILLMLGSLVHPLFWGLIGMGGAVYLKQPFRRLSINMQKFSQPSLIGWIIAIMWIPIIRVVGDVAKMLGYPVGWRWRLQHRPPDWKKVE